MNNKHEIDKARSVYYGLFASLLTGISDDEKLNLAKKTIDLLASNPFNNECSIAFTNMQNLLISSEREKFKEEANDLFFNPYVSGIPVTASYWIEGRDDGRKRLDMVNFVLSSKFRRNEENFKELEDHISFIMSFMQKVIELELEGDKKSGELAKKVFDEILNPFVDEFAEAVFEHQDADFYRNLMVVLESFVAFERLYFGVSKPTIEILKGKIHEQKAKKT